MTPAELSKLAINTIRTLSIDMVQKADSGHPGLPLGCAPMAYTLWQRHLRLDPKAPTWFGRDRFVLSAGHGSALLYSMLHLSGFALPMDEIKQFRQWGSRTPGHPEWHHTVGVEATTGPLGQGTANAVGMAFAEKFLATMFNRPGHNIIDHFTYALVSDGDMMEGISHEASALAGHLELGKLIYMYDANHVTLDGPLSLSMSDDVGKRYEAYGWHVQHVTDGNDNIDAIDKAIAAAKAETKKPSMIIINTTIGFGSPKKQGTSSAHGSPLGVAEVAATKKALGWDPEKFFYVPDEVAAHMAEPGKNGAKLHAAWDARVAAWRNEFPELGAQFDEALSGKLPKGWDSALPTWKKGESLATRAAGGKVLEAASKTIPWLVGGDADLSGSTKTLVTGGNFNAEGVGRNLRFGIREHAMGAIANGMHYHGGMIPFVSTFFVFSDYMRPPVRIAALNGQRCIYVWTHDSIGLGEDGPTHQPVEQMAALRAMPNLHVIRPADANETAAAWRMALERNDGPTALVLSRQDLPVVTDAGAQGTEKGAYILAEPTAAEGAAKVILMATGSEVSLALEAKAQLSTLGIASRVVSMPCTTVFAAQPQSYRDQVLPPTLTARVSIEAGVTFGWREWVGDKGQMVGVDKYGASAPPEVLLAKYGLTAEAVVRAAQTTIAQSSK